MVVDMDDGTIRPWLGGGGDGGTKVAVAVQLWRSQRREAALRVRESTSFP